MKGNEKEPPLSSYQEFSLNICTCSKNTYQFLFAKPRVETEASISIVYLSSNKWVRPNVNVNVKSKFSQ